MCHFLTISAITGPFKKHAAATVSWFLLEHFRECSFYIIGHNQVSKSVISAVCRHKGKEEKTQHLGKITSKLEKQQSTIFHIMESSSTKFKHCGVFFSSLTSFWL